MLTVRKEIWVDSHDAASQMQQILHQFSRGVGEWTDLVKGKTKRRRIQADPETSEVNTESTTSQTSVLPGPRTRPSKASLTPVRVLADDTLATMPLQDERAEKATKLLCDQFAAIGSNAAYADKRQTLLSKERLTRWDEPARSRASEVERHAQAIVFKIRESERKDEALFGNLPGEAVPDSRTRDMGGRFLVNKSTIRRSAIFKIAQKMPKGSHLHLHFNSELPPEVLFPMARSDEMKQTMFIRSTRPLRHRSDFETTEIVFGVLPKETRHANCFDSNYDPDMKHKANSPWMLWADFRKRFPANIELESRVENLDDAECWAREKMSITRQLAYHDRQTHNGAWACFNQGTRAFKGLVNYEGVYRWYIGHAIDSMIRDKVMYAELRPMLLDKSIPSNDGTRQLDHKDQMTIICEEVTKKRKELEAAGQLDKFPFGLKIIYCTPRSIPRQRMQTELQDCIKLKLQFRDLICGFDLVGAEDRPNHVGFYADLLVAFTETCDDLGIKIPFMFHAGETLLDTGGSFNPDNSNLYDALLLKAKRIGHGYALLKHPMLIEKYKQRNICLELCPISNELLHLCGNAREHPYPALLAAGLQCTLNADNPSLFSSSLSHEFYQVMVGDTRMTIHGWKQLAEWSIEHSCLTPEEIKRGLEIFRRDFEAFCKWIVASFGDYADGLKPLSS